MCRISDTTMTNISGFTIACICGQSLETSIIFNTIPANVTLRSCMYHSWHQHLILLQKDKIYKFSLDCQNMLKFNTNHKILKHWLFMLIKLSFVFVSFLLEECYFWHKKESDDCNYATKLLFSFRKKIPGISIHSQDRTPIISLKCCFNTFHTFDVTVS